MFNAIKALFSVISYIKDIFPKKEERRNTNTAKIDKEAPSQKFIIIILISFIIIPIIIGTINYFNINLKKETENKCLYHCTKLKIDQIKKCHVETERVKNNYDISIENLKKDHINQINNMSESNKINVKKIKESCKMKGLDDNRQLEENLNKKYNDEISKLKNENEIIIRKYEEKFKIEKEKEDERIRNAIKMYIESK